MKLNDDLELLTLKVLNAVYLTHKGVNDPSFAQIKSLLTQAMKLGEENAKEMMEAIAQSNYENFAETINGGAR